MRHADAMSERPTALPATITEAFRAARESVRHWTPIQADDGSLDPDVRAITDEINELHRAVDRRLAELGGEPVKSPPGGPVIGRVFQLNAVVTLPEPHDLNEVERRFSAVLRTEELFARSVTWDGCRKLFEEFG